MEFGERLRKLRIERNITQYQLAELSQISQQTISSIERGRNEPSAESIRSLANALGISSSELLGENMILEDHKLTPREYEMISEFRKLNPIGQKNMIELALYYQTKEEYQKK